MFAHSFQNAKQTTRRNPFCPSEWILLCNSGENILRQETFDQIEKDYENNLVKKTVLRKIKEKEGDRFMFSTDWQKDLCWDCFSSRCLVSGIEFQV